MQNPMLRNPPHNPGKMKNCKSQCSEIHPKILNKWKIAKPNPQKSTTLHNAINARGNK
jgi:hypothetical protein